MVRIKACSHTGAFVSTFTDSYCKGSRESSHHIQTHTDVRGEWGVCACLTCCVCVSTCPITESSVMGAWRRLVCAWLPRSAAVDSNTHSSSSEAYTGALISHTDTCKHTITTTTTTYMLKQFCVNFCVNWQTVSVFIKQHKKFWWCYRAVINTYIVLYIYIYI